MALSEVFRSQAFSILCGVDSVFWPSQIHRLLRSIQQLLPVQECAQLEDSSVEKKSTTPDMVVVVIVNCLYLVTNSLFYCLTYAEILLKQNSPGVESSCSSCIMSGSCTEYGVRGVRCAVTAVVVCGPIKPRDSVRMEQ